MTTELQVRGAFSPTNISEAWRISEGLSKSEMIPKDFQAKPHNVMVALMVAHDIGLSPFTVMQNMCVIHGRPRWYVKFLIAQANRAGVFSSPIDWEITGKGKDLSVKAFATLKANKVTVSVSCSMAEAQAEGWTKNPKYSSMPEQMLRWRSAGRLVDLYCPEVALGIPSEVEDVLEPVSDVSEAPTSSQAVLPPAQPRTRTPRRKAEPVTIPAQLSEETIEETAENIAQLKADLEAVELRMREVSEEIFAISTSPERNESEAGKKVELIEEREDLKSQRLALRQQIGV